MSRLQDAAKELLTRKKAQNSLKEYCKYTLEGFRDAKHQDLIFEALEKVTNGEITRLMINMPPRHGKTELASVRFPAYYLSRFPTREVIFATASQDFADDIGVKLLSCLGSDAHKKVFEDFKIDSSNPKRGSWKTTKRGSYYASGVGGQLTGRGANLIIVDDPIKNMEDAESDTGRRKLWDWYNTTLATRKTNTGLPEGQKAAIIVIQTKWHEDDLSGRLFKEMMDGGEEWTVLNLPAVTFHGKLPTNKEFEKVDELKALWPEEYDLKQLLIDRGKDPVRKRQFSCLYQQQPVPDEGVYFSRDWFHKYDPIDLPDGLTIYGCSDYALSEGKGDFTWHLIVGVDSNHNYWIIDGYRAQTNMLKWIDAQIDLIAVHRPVAWIGEAGLIRRASEPFVRKRLRERATYCKLDYIIRTRDKAVEARSLQAVAAQKRIHIPNIDLGDELLSQMVRFPATKYDDAVDCLANLFLAVDKLYGGTDKISKPKKVRDAWDKAFSRKENDETDWRTI